MRAQRLRKESFGGILLDYEHGKYIAVEPEKYQRLSQTLPKTTLINVEDSGIPLLIYALSSPIILFLELTKQCNSHCKHCFMNAVNCGASSSEMRFDQLKQIIEQFDYYGGFYIRLTGGEPTIHPNFFDLIEFIQQYSLKIGLNTNGLFNDEMIYKILSTGIKDIRISLDGPKEINDELRGKGNYDQVVNTLEKLAAYNIAQKNKDNKIEITINTTLTKQNQHAIRAMVLLAAQLNVKLSFGLLRPAGRASAANMCSKKEVLMAAKKIHILRNKLNLPNTQIRINYDLFSGNTVQTDFAPSPIDRSKCPAAIQSLAIDANGNGYPCGYFVNCNWPKETILNRNIIDFWHNSPSLNQLRSLTKLHCLTCQHWGKNCNGGCPLTAYLQYNDIAKPDPYCCKSYYQPIK